MRPQFLVTHERCRADVHAASTDVAYDAGFPAGEELIFMKTTNGALARPERQLHFAPLEATMMKVKTILVPTDFSDCSEAAVKYGYALAETFGATVHLLNVVQDPYAMPWTTDAFAAPIGSMLTDWEAEANRRLVETVPAASPAPTVLRTVVGSPYSGIVQYAEQHHVDLIVLGTHGRGPLGHMLLGSVAERVVRTAPCPVLTVRHPQRELVTEAKMADKLETVGVPVA